MAFIKPKSSQTIPTDERQRERDIDGLIEQLNDPDPGQRRWAARDLAVNGSAVPMLIARLAFERESMVREALLMSLTEIGTPEAVSGLVTCLRSEDPALRNDAIEAMKSLPDAVAPIMAGLLVDRDPDVRIFAVNILESLCHPEVEGWLIDVISRDGHVNVCATAVDLLGEVGTDAALAPLEGVKARFADEPYIGFAADVALKRIRGS